MLELGRSDETEFPRAAERAAGVMPAVGRHPHGWHNGRRSPKTCPVGCRNFAPGLRSSRRAAGGTAFARGKPCRLGPLDEGDVGGLGGVGVPLETALLVVVRDGLLQLRERLIPAHGALRQLLPAPG